MNHWTSLLLLCSFLLVIADDGLLEGDNQTTSYQVFEYDWHRVSAPYTTAIWILLACIAKIGFHTTKKITDTFPDSALLIIVGLLFGSIIWLFGNGSITYSLKAEIFFLYLLPPIAFDAGYNMSNRAFFDNLGSVLTFAIFGTVWNAATIGISLWAVSLTGIFTIDTPLLHVLLFSSLISSTDPVSVIAFFEEIHVNQLLLITVFAESLLNDAVSIALFRISKSLVAIGAENLSPANCAAGGMSFFTVGIGGVLIGLLGAFIVSLTTKYTKEVDLLNPVFVFVMPYCAYLTAEMFGMSAIIAIVFCGIAMKQYIKLNLTAEATTSIKYFVKAAAGMSETFIFLFLGLSTIRKHHWDIAFISFAVLFCLVYRVIGVILQSFLLNKFRLVPYTKVDQFVMAYGGLRGPMAFGMLTDLPNSIPEKDLFVTTTLVIIYFTVIFQGTTMMPLVNWLKVKLDHHRQKTMTEHMFEKQIDFLMVGVEDICAFRGHHWLRDSFERFNSRWLIPLLVTKTSLKLHGSKLVREFTRLKLIEAADFASGRVASFITFSPPNLALDNTNEIKSTSFTNRSINPELKREAEAIADEYIEMHQLL